MLYFAVSHHSSRTLTKLKDPGQVTPGLCWSLVSGLMWEHIPSNSEHGACVEPWGSFQQLKKKQKKKADRKVNTTPTQDSKHFWVSEGIPMVWKRSVGIHSLDAHQRHSVAAFFPGWVQNWITPGFGMNLQILSPQKDLRSGAQQLWKINHM